MKFKIGEAVWYINTCGNASIDLFLGKLIDIQKDKAILLLGFQGYSGDYEEVKWGVDLRDIFAFDDYKEAKKKLLVYAEK